MSLIVKINQLVSAYADFRDGSSSAAAVEELEVEVAQMVSELENEISILRKGAT